jgi:ubiquinone biosynthesis protein Coq4
MAKQDKPYRINLLSGAKEMLVANVNPVSERGTAAKIRILGHWGGPLMARRVRMMKADPQGRRLLAERPDLAATLSDMDRLGAMPEGTLGRAYFDFFQAPAMAPGYLVTGTVYRDGFYRKMESEWGEETLWLFNRFSASHDLMHVLGGYGWDATGEVLNIGFSAGAYSSGRFVRPGLVSKAVGLGLGIVIKPSVGMGRWMRAVDEGIRRGAQAASTTPFHLVPWEDWLEDPIEDVRRRLGMDPLVHGNDDTSTWLTRPQAAKFADGGPELVAWIRDGRALAEAGVPFRKMMEIPIPSREVLRQMFHDGASVEEMTEFVEREHARAYGGAPARSAA